MNKYETIVVFNPDINPQGLDAEVLNIKRLLESHGAKDIQIEDWGRRDLAHAVKKQKYGRYICYQYASEQHEVVNQSNATLRITDSVLKFQSHRLSDKQPKFRGNPRLLSRKDGPVAAVEDDDFDELIA